MENATGKKICGAKTRRGTPCQSPPAKGKKRCRLHGGASLAGIESPSFKHGLGFLGPKIRKVEKEVKHLISDPLSDVDACKRADAAVHALLDECWTVYYSDYPNGCSPSEKEEYRNKRIASVTRATQVFQTSARHKIDLESVHGETSEEKPTQININIVDAGSVAEPKGVD